MRVIAFLIALLWASSALAEAPSDVRDEVVRMLAAKPLRADLVVVLDVSGSMAKHFDVTKAFVGDLAALARPDDTITFIAFADHASELMPPVTVKNGGADTLRARLNRLHVPRAKNTDLGAGLEAVLDALVRPNYAPLSMVFLITDFCAEPPPKSPHAGAKEGNGPCRKVTITESLKKKSARLFGAGDQAVKSFALALEPASEAGLAAAREALGSLVRIDVAAAELKGALDNVRARMAYDRAALTIEQMLKHPPIGIEPASGTARGGEPSRDGVALQGPRVIDLGLVSNGPLAMRVHPQKIRALDSDLSLALADGDRIVVLPARGDAGATTIPIQVRAMRSGGRLPSPFAWKRAIDVELTLDVELMPEAPIEKLIGGAPRSTAEVRERIDVRFLPPDSEASPVAFTFKPSDVELFPGGTTPVEIRARSLIGWADLEANCTLGDHAFETIRLAPTSTATLETKVTNDAEPRPWWIESTRKTQAELSGACEVAAVAFDGMKFPLGRHPLHGEVSMSWREGIPLPIVLGVALTLIALLSLYFFEIRPRLQPAALNGRLVVYRGPGEFRKVAIPLRGRARIALEGSPAKNAEVRLDGDRVVLPDLEGTAAELYAEKVGRRSVMRLRKLQGEVVVLDEQPLETAPVVVRRGRVRFSLGLYRFRIE
jgi:hypothetical protein